MDDKDNIQAPPQIIISFDNLAVSSDSNGAEENIPTSESILNEAKKLDFSKQDSVEVDRFRNKYEDLFRRRTLKNFLRVLVERSAPGEAEDAQDLEMVLEQKNMWHQTHMHLAVISTSPVVKLLAQKYKELRINEIRKPASATDSHTIKIVSIFDEWKKINLSSGRESQVTPKAVADLLLKLVHDLQEPEGRMSQVQVIRLLISCRDTFLSDKGVVDCDIDNEATEELPEELTPYQMRLSDLKDAWKNLIEFLEQGDIRVSKRDMDSALRLVIIEDPVADAIRSHCLHNFDRGRIAECLYQPGHERDIDFDLSGLPDPTISKSLLKCLSNNLKLESILLYVALPKLTLDKCEETSGENGKNGENGEKSTSPVKKSKVADLRDVFDWLRQNGVKSIITVTVIDHGHPSHSDEMIEEALKGFQVENWDWKRDDLCTDVIAASSNQIKSISLYSSGNNAVLMGWASSEGLLNREKFPQGKASTKRREGNIEAFERKVRSIMVQKKYKQEPIEVEHRLDDGKVSYAAYFGTNNIITHQEISWISELERFAVFLSSEKSIRAQNTPIKIAIIDDGIDVSLDIFTGKIAAGRSFWPLSGSGNPTNAYYVPSGHHGTMMADLICRICPSVQL
ncbi:uncharacterized protein TrAtP1_009937 [Trichoderma atroviride]|uniref:uncharacterized protein n=1 Tax=Hypocrea atroviridis TaxID=63577 RepID=UPI003332BEB7|nr:hypothetical protein TrAtP1_009937 [Trichoderma atroviride]